MFGTKSRLFRGHLVLVAVMLLTACVSSNEATKEAEKETAKPPEVALQERAQAYWEAKRTGDLATAYRMEMPEEGSDRPNLSLAAYAAQGKRSERAQLVGVKIKEVKVEGDEGLVTMDYAQAIYFFGKAHVMEGSTVDRWQRVDGQWYHVLPAPPDQQSATKE